MLIATTIGLGVLCLILTAMVVRLFKTLEANRRQLDDPENFCRMLKAMIKRVQFANDWNALDRMRDDVRRGLGDLDRLRHDVKRVDLRASKAQSSGTT